MNYSISELTHLPEALDELAAFLAAFAERGELVGAPPADSDPALWKKRMRWWWDENPFCQDGSPTGFTLRTETGELVGFHGLIPFDYCIGGQPIPGLISSIFFVFSEHRAASMKLFLKVQRLAQNFHLVDGGPTDDMTQILKRFGYRQGGSRKFYFYTLGFKWRRRPLRSGLHLITDPSEIVSIPDSQDGHLRRNVTRDSLLWLSSVGTRSRQFLGACDGDGRLVAYALGLCKKLPGGFIGCQIADYRSFDESRCEVFELLEHIASTPKAAPLKKGLVALIWGVENGATRPRKFGLEKPSKVYYTGPKALESNQKIVLPIEGDFSFF